MRKPKVAGAFVGWLPVDSVPTMATTLINPNPTVYQVSEIIRRDLQELTDGEFDDFDSLEIFGTHRLLRCARPMDSSSPVGLSRLARL